VRKSDKGLLEDFKGPSVDLHEQDFLLIVLYETIIPFNLTQLDNLPISLVSYLSLRP
jgi:hypothetical protein